jgi:DinB superfamily
MNPHSMILELFDEAFERKTWHGPNLWQSLKGITAKQAAWRPVPNRHNIWEETLHAAYWKYAVRRRLQGATRGSFVLKGSNFFRRPDVGKLTEFAWKADKAILQQEHAALRIAIKSALNKPLSPKVCKMLWGIAFHDVYHAGQIRLLRRLMQK